MKNIRCCAVVAKNKRKITYHLDFSLVKYGSVKIYEFYKRNFTLVYLHENEADED